MTTGLYGLPEPTLPKPPPSRLRRRLKIVLGLIAVFIFSLWVLHMMGSNSKNMKDAIERFLTGETGLQTKIGTLNAVEFFPVIGIDMDNVTFSSGNDVRAHIGHFNFSTGFWGASFGGGIRTLNIRDFHTGTGVAAPGAITLDRFFIDATKAGGKPEPVLRLKGTYAGKPVRMAITLSPETGFWGALSFGLGARAPFTLTASTMQATGFLTAANGGRRIDVDRFTTKPGTPPIRFSIAFTVPDHGVELDGHAKANAGAMAYDATLLKKGKAINIQAAWRGDITDISALDKPGSLLEGIRTAYNFYAFPGDESENAPAESAPWLPQAVQTLFPTTETQNREKLHISCATAIITQENGKATIHALSLQTDRGHATGTGTLNPVTGTMDMVFSTEDKTKTRSGLRLAGPITAPHISTTAPGKNTAPPAGSSCKTLANP